MLSDNRLIQDWSKYEVKDLEKHQQLDSTFKQTEQAGVVSRPAIKISDITDQITNLSRVAHDNPINAQTCIQKQPGGSIYYCQMFLD